MKVRKMTIAGLVLLAVAAGAALFGCGDNSTGSAPGEIRMTLVDAPATYDAVNIVVTEVSVHMAGADSSSGWVVVNDSTRTFNLLELTGGASALLGDEFLAPGHYTQIRLLLSDASSIVVDGVSFPLVVPSGLQSGLKLNHEFEIESDTRYDLTLDFDAQRSIVLTGAGVYMLSPVIRVVATAASGSIIGVIDPASAHATVSTVVFADTVSTAADTTSGAFTLPAIPGGTYSVHVVPEAGFQDTTLTNVVVTAGTATNVGTITLHP